MGIGIPHTLSDLGAEESHVATFAPMAARDPSAATNPLPLDEASLAGLYQRTIRGELHGA